jgi:hypothetical protein
LITVIPGSFTEGADDDIGSPVVPGWLVLPVGFGLLGLPWAIRG